MQSAASHDWKFFCDKEPAGQEETGFGDGGDSCIRSSVSTGRWPRKEVAVASNFLIEVRNCYQRDSFPGEIAFSGDADSGARLRGASERGCGKNKPDAWCGGTCNLRARSRP